MALWSDMLAEVLPDVPGCPDEAAERALRHAAREFLEDTQAQTETRTVSIGAGAAVVLPTSALLVADILSATIGTEEVPVLASNAPRPHWASDLDLFLRWDGVSISCDLAQAASTSVVLELVTLPGTAATGIDDVIWQAYSEDIAHGALQRLLAQPKKPWSDPSTAAYHLQMFEAAKKSAAFDVGTTRQHKARRLRVKPA